MKPFFCLFSQLTLLRSIEAPLPSLTISKRGISTSPLSFPKPFEHTREKGEREIGFFFFYLHISLDSKDRRRPGVISCLLAFAETRGTCPQRSQNPITSRQVQKRSNPLAAATESSEQINSPAELSRNRKADVAAEATMERLTTRRLI